jgi:DNA-binding transcriptional LysR family regulator
MTEELRQFLLVVEHGTFTAAAAAAHRSQPALTVAIQRLEDELGARLLERGPSGARPTAAGQALLPFAEAALAALERGRRAVASIERLEAGEVHLAAGSTACTVFLPPVLTAFHRAHPGVRLYLREAIAEEIIKQVQLSRYDLGVVPGPGTETWLQDELVLVAAPGIEPAAAPHLTFPPGANHRELLERHFPGVEIAMELSSLSAVRAHVEAGMGVALLSRASVAHELERGSLVVVEDARTPVVRTMSLVHRGLETLSPAARALRDRLMGLPAPRATAGSAAPPGAGTSRTSRARRDGSR